MTGRHLGTLVVAVAGAVCAPALADTRVWTGSVGNDWFETGNWSPTGAPLSSDTLYVYSGPTQTGSYVKVDGGGSIAFDGATASGTFDNGYFDVGSTANGVLHLAGCDVLAVRVGEQTA